MSPCVRQATSADYDAILVMNEAAVPHVNSISCEELQKLHESSIYLGVVTQEGSLTGFLLVLNEGQDYQSVNYRWFGNRYDRFTYVDRIVIDKNHRQSGFGRRLYEDLILQVAGTSPWLTCEVNLAPPNPASIIFHQGLGFTEVGQQETDGGDKRVSLMARSLAEV